MLAALRALLDTVPSLELESFLSDWPRRHNARAVTATPLPALRWLPQILSQAPRAAGAVTCELGACAARLCWRRTYPVEGVSRSFLDNYAWTELLGPNGELPSSRLAAGFLVLGPHTAYPPHAHRAEEIYLPISGTAHWWKSSDEWREIAPLTLVLHASSEAHAMRTGDQPLLALYLWHGPGLEDKAYLVAPGL